MNIPRKFSFLSMFIVALLLTVAIGSSTHKTARAQASDLFFSEYIEGSSNNKALEIYNGTGATIDLAADGYDVFMSFNGGTSTLEIDLTGTVDDGDVYVLAHSSAVAAITDVADQTNGAGWYNGDDAVVLRKGTDIVDVIGEVGFDPGSQWGSGLTSTADNTLRRLSNVCAGDTNPDDEFDPALEWEGFAQDTFDGLGSHTASCEGGGPADPVINEYVANHAGTDTNAFVEIFGDPSTDYSAFTVLEIEGDGSPMGVIDAVLPVGTTNADGYWTNPEDMENGTITILLVENFTGSLGNDLDTNNDGVLDLMPWDRLVDDVTITDGDGGDGLYSSTVLDPTFAGGSFAPGGASRIPNGVDTDSAGDWTLNDFDGFGFPDFDGTPDAGEAVNTPGAENELVSVTPDIVINEIMQNPSAVADSAGEWFELYNATDVDVDIDGWTLVDNDTDSHVINNGGPLVIPAGGYLVLGNNGNTGTNGGVTVDYVYSGYTLANGADEVVLFDGDGAEMDRVEYDGGATFPSPNGASMALSDPELDNNNGDNWCTSSTSFGDGDLGTPGAANDCDGNGGDGEVGQCTDPVTHFIHEVQGDGLASPIVGTEVEIQGVVVGDYQNNGQPDNGDLEGFFLQEEDTDADGNPATSEGIFIFDGSSPALDVQNGDVVRVLGTVSEFFNRTEISLADAVVCDSGATVTPAQPTLPVDNVNDLEAYEGMSVLFTQDLYISEYFNFDRFGEIVLTSERQFQPTAVFEPGSPEAAALADFNSRSRITLDDGLDVQNPDPALHPNGAEFTLDNRFRGGDIVRNLPGVMDFGFSQYRIQPTTGGEHIVDNPRPAAPEDVGGDIQVASFNVLNYFTTLNEGGNLCGPPGFEQECRGADTQEELERQRAKIVSAIATMDADVVGLIEIQNDEGASTEDLVNGLNDLLGAGTYDYIDTGFIGTDAIKQAFIYQPASVTPVGDYAVLDTAEFIDPNNTGSPKNRPALAQSFEENASGNVFTTVVNHLKSKGSGCGDGDDDPQQGNCNLTRTLSAQILADWLATDPTNSGDPDVLIIGDLNAYDKEDPIDVLVNNGYTDLLHAFEGELAYTYVFDGQLGYLDHALANAALLPQVTGATAWHINADEPDIIDYDMTFKQDAQDALYEPNAYRSSDHDPVIVGLQFNSAPVCDGAEPSISMLWPPNHQFVSIEVEGVTDPDGDPVTITIDSIFQDEAVDAPGSGNTAPDGMGIGTSTAQVRAERVGGGNGRVYHIFFTATDGNGGSCSGEVLVGVPKSPNRTAVDDGALFDSTVTP